MSSKRIRGITIEIDGNTTKLTDKLQGLDKQISKTGKELQDVNRLLKLDPSNTELLTQKQQLLGKQIKDTGDRIEELKKAQESMKDATGSVPEDQAEAYNALTREIIETTNKFEGLKSQQENVSAALQNGTSEAEEAAKKTKEYGDASDEAADKVHNVREKTLENLEALQTIADALDNVSQKLVSLGEAAVQQRDTFDTALDNVQYGLGATNTEMSEYEDLLNNIAQTIPVDDMTDLGNAIATVGTKTGLTGTELEDVMDNIAKLSKLSGESASSIADDAITVAKNFGVSYNEALDVMMNASQGFGIAFSDLANMSESAGQTLTGTFGLSIDQVTGLMGVMEAAGVDSSQAITGLTRAAKNMSEDGTASLEGLNEVLAGLSDGTISAADAYDIFGSRATNLINYLQQSGISSVEDLTKAYQDAEGPISTVSDMYDEMYDSGDQAVVAQQSLSAAMASIGDTIRESLAPLLTKVADALKSIKDWWDNLSPDMQGLILTIGEIVLTLSAAIGAIASVGKVVTALTPVIAQLNAVMSANPIGIIIMAIAAVVTALVLLWNNCEGFRKWVEGAWDWIKNAAVAVADAVINTFNAVKDALTNAWNTVTGVITDGANKVKEGVSNAWENVKTKTSETWENVKQNTTEAWNTIKDATRAAWDGMQQSIADHGGGIKGVVGTIIDGIKATWSAGFEWIDKLTGGKLSGIVDSIRGFYDKIVNGVKNIVQGIKDAIKLPHFKIEGSFSLKPLSVPHLAVTWYKKAMDTPYILDGATIFGASGNTLLGGGEAGREAIMSEEKLKELAGGTRIVNNITINQLPGEDSTDLARRVTDQIQWRLARGLA